MLGLAIWTWTLFVYIKSSGVDDLMHGTVPLGWVWMHFTDASHGWYAASSLCFWIVYALIDFVELMGVFMFQSGGDRNFLVFWGKYFGLWVSTVLKILPWVFALVNAVNLSWSLRVNSSILAAVGIFSWLYTLVIHSVFNQRLAYHVKALDMEPCWCNDYESCKAVYEKNNKCPKPAEEKIEEAPKEVEVPVEEEEFSDAAEF